MAQARMEMRFIPYDTHLSYIQKLGFGPCTTAENEPDHEIETHDNASRPADHHHAGRYQTNADQPSQIYCRDDGATIHIQAKTVNITDTWSIEVVTLDVEAKDAQTLDDLLRSYRIMTMQQ
ncbi:MAG: hypothetical protein IMX04_01775 [Candidatus Carbobacillus altaicus]|nr:hypothetical protein [Candidatus Carbobacillus altaicus]